MDEWIGVERGMDCSRERNWLKWIREEGMEWNELQMNRLKWIVVDWNELQRRGDDCREKDGRIK